MRDGCFGAQQELVSGWETGAATCQDQHAALPSARYSQRGPSLERSV